MWDLVCVIQISHIYLEPVCDKSQKYNYMENQSQNTLHVLTHHLYLLFNRLNTLQKGSYFFTSG